MLSLISTCQALARVFFFMGEEHIRSKSLARRIGLNLAFVLVHVVIQGVLNQHIRWLPQNSISTILRFCITMCYYMLFVHLWSDASLSVCALMALLFQMIDNYLWAMLSIIQEWLLKNAYFSGDSFTQRLLLIFLFLVFECVLLYRIHQLLPSMQKIHPNRDNITILLLSMIPFFYYRILSSQFSNGYDQFTQAMMTLYSLIMTLVLVGSIRHTSNEFENRLSEKVQYMLQCQQQQFQKKLHDVDLVNRKYHDMKNILLYLERQNGTEIAQEQIRKMMDEIRPYETQIDTGNETIDMILNDKLTICQEKEICCTPYLDGSVLNFVDPLDLCIIFGNALDNAIESCQQILNPEERQISIKTVKKGNTTLLMFRNTYAKAPVMKGKVPVTTKADKKEHGYGLKNIRYTAEKYQGEMSCTVENQEFILSILFLEAIQRNER